MLECKLVPNICSRTQSIEDERGFALILTVFIVALATILVLDFSSETLSYQRQSRAYVERIQADYMVKSTLNVARLLLELPKLQIDDQGQLSTVQEDWLGEPWALVAAVPSLPLPGSPRLTIVDDYGKIDINSIVSTVSGGSQQSPQPGSAQVDTENFWKNALSELLTLLGFVREQYDPGDHRTLGDTGYAAAEQVAVIHDWIDRDSDSHTSAAFPGEGIESSSDRKWFFNRPLWSLSELAMVPGITLERLARIAPYVRVSRPNTIGSSRINVNTAPRAVLLALGFPESQVLEIEQIRLSAPISSQDLQTLTAGDAQLAQVAGVRSSSFSAFVRVQSANSTRWGKAIFDISGGRQRRALLRSLELH